MSAELERAVTVTEKYRQFNIVGVAAGSLAVGDRQIELAVLVEVSRRDPAGISQDCWANQARLERSVAVSEQNHVPAGICRIAREGTDHIKFAISIEITHCPSARIVARKSERRGSNGRLERSIAVPQHDQRLTCV